MTGMKRFMRLTKKTAARPKGPPDPNLFAHAVIQEMTQRSEGATTPPKVTSEISQYMSALGRRGGKVGGRSRAESLRALHQPTQPQETTDSSRSIRPPCHGHVTARSYRTKQGEF